MINFICYPKCTTCQKAKKWLDDNKIEYVLRDIKLDNPTLEELTTWYNKSGLPLKKFFNTSGLLYKSLDLKSKLHEMSEIATHISEEQKERAVFKKAIGNYMYTIENNGFGNYRIVGRRKL